MTTGTVRRLLVVGTARGANRASEAAEKLGGTAVARLLTSGEKRRRHRRQRPRLRRGCGGARRACGGAALVALRPLSDQAQGQAEADARRGRRSSAAAQGAGERYAVALGAGGRGRLADPRARHRAGQHHLSRELRRARPGVARRHRRRDRGARPGAMEKLGMGALLGVAQGSVREARLLILSGTAAARAASRSPSSARA